MLCFKYWCCHNHVLRSFSKPGWSSLSSFLSLPLQSVVFSASPDSTIRVWSVTGGNCVQVVRAHEAGVTGLSLHATGDYLLSSSEDQVCVQLEKTPTVILVTVNTLTSRFMSPLFCSTGHFLTSRLVEFSPKSQMKVLAAVSASVLTFLFLLLFWQSE